MEKKSVILWFLLSLSLVIIVCALFVPTVHIVGHMSDEFKTVVYNKSTNFVTYLVDNPFWTTPAADVYFSSTGPVWMATGAIMLNLLVCVMAFMMLVFCIIELCTNNKTLMIKSNVLTKKLCFFAGGGAIFVGIFSIVSFITTTKMANGYEEFFVSACPFVFILLGIIVIILASKLQKRQYLEGNKKKSVWGFAFCGIMSVASFACLFVPVFMEGYLPKTSIFGAASMAGELVYEPSIVNMYGDFAFGIVLYLLIALAFVTVFVFIYSLIGFIRALMGKTTNFLSSRIKRWSMVFLIVYSLIFMLVLCQTAVLSAAFLFDGYLVLNWFFFVLLFIPFLPYIFSTFVQVEKKQKKQKNNE